MPNILRVDTNDKLRVLLTDVLPYELPLWFTNYNLYQRFSNDNQLKAYETISGLQFKNDKGVYIPLNYHISRGGSLSPRIISIMHPVAQLKVCDFYQEYENLIEYYCTKSKHSLRHPYRVATKFYGKAQNGTKSLGGVEGIDEESIVSSSHFKYKKYPFLYRFFESYEYHTLEKQFNSMLQVDVSKCFPSIYTHSIGWAVKGKRLAKAKSDGSFDGSFDELMQLTNYRETNGIIIGPEVSRIFAEIILQRIDLNLNATMESKGYKVSKDYDFRRYVDDYFVFYRSNEVRESFVKSLELCLSEYKLYLNEAKTTIASRPFATNISLAKHSLKQSVKNYFSTRFNNNNIDCENIKILSRPDFKANKTISEIKMSLAANRVEYTSISNYLFSAIYKKMVNYLTMIEKVDNKEEHHLNWVLVDLDVIFFVHAMDIRIRPTDRLARLINELLEVVKTWPNHFQMVIHKKIFDHVKQAINIFISNSNNMFGLETLNLLIILTMLPKEYQLTESKVEEYFNSLNETSITNDLYFTWVTLMLYIKDSPEYNNLRMKLIDKAESYLLGSEDMFIDAEYFMFYFDYMACPHIPAETKLNICEKVKKITLTPARKAVTFQVQEQFNKVRSKDFIVSWQDPDYLKSCLQKREFNFPYN